MLVRPRFDGVICSCVYFVLVFWLFVFLVGSVVLLVLRVGRLWFMCLYFVLCLCFNCQGLLGYCAALRFGLRYSCSLLRFEWFTWLLLAILVFGGRC